MDSTTRPSESTDIVLLDPRSPAQIEDAMGQLHAIENATRRQRLHLAFIYDARSLWTDDGARCMEEWLRAKYSMSWSSARDFLRVAHALEPPRDRGGLQRGPVELGSAPAADRDRHP